MPETILRACLICDGARIEHPNKATLLGFYGMTPDVDFAVVDTSAPIMELCFLLISFSVTELGPYQVGLSVKNPAGILLFPMVEQTIPVKKRGAFVVGFQFRPFGLSGVGKYTVNTMVNGKLDLESQFTVSQATAESQNR